MNQIYPQYEEFIKLYKQYKHAYLSIFVQGDTETPISLFKKLQNGKGCFLLESVENAKDWGRFSYIGRTPFIEIVGNGENIEIIENENRKIVKGNPIENIKNILDTFAFPKDANMIGYFGGAIGFIGYDMARHQEGIYFDKPDEIGVHDVHLVFPEEVISYDHVMKRIIITVHICNEENEDKAYRDAKSRLKQIKNEISNDYISMVNVEIIPSSFKVSSSETKESFIEKVKKVKEYIVKGDIFQAVISQRLSIDTNVHPFEVYRSLRVINPSPYMYYMDFGDYFVVGSSPEMLTKIEKGIITTCPIAGTRPRGENKEEDYANEKSLISDEKELAEHVMLVDLARNDIGRVSEFGSVHLSEYMNVRRYSHVMHIVSLVYGKFKKNIHTIDGLMSCLPAGTVSGAPKKRAMQIIDMLEEKKRGIYAGAIGWFGFDGSMDTCIAIRTIIFKNNKAYIQAGAGIVADSDPESEYEETLKKASALLDAISETGGVEIYGNNN